MSRRGSGGGKRGGGPELAKPDGNPSGGGRGNNPPSGVGRGGNQRPSR